LENNRIDFDSLFFGRSSSSKASNVLPDGLKDDLDFEPSVRNSFAEYGEYQLVGHGEQTNEHCGQFMRFKGCAREALHDLITLEGKNFKEKAYIWRVRHWCNKPSCPICFKSGWAVREAGNIEARSEVASRRFGLVEHIVCSVPVRDYGLSFKALRRKAVKVLKGRGVLGGVIIFHAFRYNVRKHWFWSPHFHCLGFIKGGFGRCRACKKKGRFRCYDCDGFKGCQARGYKKDGYIVKVLGRRKTVFGTAWYQLHHSSIRKGVRRFHVATWFGVVSYRKMKVEKRERKEKVCPICGHELVFLHYCGSRPICMFKRETFEDLRQDGRVVWMEYEPKRRFSGSYDDIIDEYLGFD